MKSVQWLGGIAAAIAIITVAPLAFGDPVPVVQLGAARALSANPPPAANNTKPLPAVKSEVDMLKQKIAAQQDQIAEQEQKIDALQQKLSQDHAQLTVVANTLFKLQARFTSHYHPTKRGTVYVQTLNCKAVGGAGGGGLSCVEGSKEQVLSNVTVEPPSGQ